ncbi:MAG: CBS domain-containing protein [Pyrobaculum sp.]
MLTVKELLKRSPIFLPETATIREVAMELVKNKIGLLVLTARENPKMPKAVVSERDVLRAVAQSLNLDGPAMSIANRPITVLDTDPVSAAAEKMRTHNIRHLVVVNKQGELVGVLSVRDLCFEKAILLELATAEAPTAP